MKTFYLIRHAESESNIVPERICGRSNHIRLTERGKDQAEKLGKIMNETGVKIHKVYASIAVRAIDTARLSGKHFLKNTDSIELSEEIVELSQGDWEGELRNEIYTPEMLKVINSDNWNFKAPNGESQKELEERFHSFVLKSYSENDESIINVAIFTHGFGIKCLLRKILGSDPSMTQHINIDNTSITKISYDGSRWKIHYVNHLPHLFKL